MSYSPPGSTVHGDSPGEKTGMGCHAFLQAIFSTQGWNPGLLHCRQIFLPSEPPRKPSRPEKNLQFRVCNNDKPRANSHIAVGECFFRGEKGVRRVAVNRIHGFSGTETVQGKESFFLFFARYESYPFWLLTSI